ncbi:hypothetical protein IL306_012347, partial [Fusarium sp. DS 682]
MCCSSSREKRQIRKEDKAEREFYKGTTWAKQGRKGRSSKQNFSDASTRAVYPEDEIWIKPGWKM